MRHGITALTTANATDGATVSTYTDGYTSSFVYVLNDTDSSSDFVVGGCIGGTATDSDGTTALAAASCATATGAWTNVATGTGDLAVTNAFYYSATSATETDLTAMTAVATSGVVAGISQTWVCSTTGTGTGVTNPLASNAGTTTTCSRNYRSGRR